MEIAILLSFLVMWIFILSKQFQDDVKISSKLVLWIEKIKMSHRYFAYSIICLLVIHLFIWWFIEYMSTQKTCNLSINTSISNTSSKGFVWHLLFCMSYFMIPEVIQNIVSISHPLLIHSFSFIILITLGSFLVLIIMPVVLIQVMYLNEKWEECDKNSWNWAMVNLEATVYFLGFFLLVFWWLTLSIFVKN